MQSHPIKFKCGHEKALPLDERGEELKAKIAELEQRNCPACQSMQVIYSAIERGRDER